LYAFRVNNLVGVTSGFTVAVCVGRLVAVGSFVQVAGMTKGVDVSFGVRVIVAVDAIIAVGVIVAVALMLHAARSNATIGIMGERSVNDMDFIRSSKLICFLAYHPKLRRMARWLFSRIFKPTLDQLDHVYFCYLTQNEENFLNIVDILYLNMPEIIYIDEIEDTLRASYSGERFYLSFGQCERPHSSNGDTPHLAQ